MFPNSPVFEMFPLLPMGNCSSRGLCLQFHMSYADQERYENEERPEVQRQILAEIARKLPVYTRTGNGGQLSTELVAPNPPSHSPAAQAGTQRILLTNSIPSATAGTH